MEAKPSSSRFVQGAAPGPPAASWHRGDAAEKWPSRAALSVLRSFELVALWSSAWSAAESSSSRAGWRSEAGLGERERGAGVQRAKLDPGRRQADQRPARDMMEEKGAEGAEDAAYRGAAAAPGLGAQRMLVSRSLPLRFLLRAPAPAASFSPSLLRTGCLPLLACLCLPAAAHSRHWAGRSAGGPAGGGPPVPQPALEYSGLRPQPGPGLVATCRPAPTTRPAMYRDNCPPPASAASS